MVSWSCTRQVLREAMKNAVDGQWKAVKTQWRVSEGRENAVEGQ